MPKAIADRLMEAAREAMVRYPKLSVAQAYRVALEEDRKLAQDWDRGDDAAPGSSSTMVDPGQVLMERARREGVTFREACLALPATAAAYHLGEMVTVPEKRGTVRGVEIMRAAGEPHYSERRLRPGEALRPGETRLAKLSPPECGGGTFAVMGATL